MRKRLAAIVTLGFSVILLPAIGAAQTRSIDTAHSVMTIFVFKSGLFSPFAHNHEISAPVSGHVPADPSGSVEISVDVRQMKVLDADVNPNTRAEIQETMLGPTVLDSPQFPEIRFNSTSIEEDSASSSGHWHVRGNLTLHGQSHPVLVKLEEINGHYRGSATLKQRDFGISPISLVGGTIKVKDEVRIEFDIVAAP